MAHIKLWSSNNPQTCYFHEKDEVRSGKVGTTTVGVMSCYALDVDNYDMETERDSFLGASDGVNPPGTLALTAGNYVTLAQATNAAPIEAVVAASSFTASDELLHIPARPVLKKQTWLEFWSGDGTGDLLYFVKHDKLISYQVGDGPPVFIN